MRTDINCICESEDPITLPEISEFFSLFRAVYTAVRHYRDVRIDDILAEADDLKESIHEAFSDTNLYAPVQALSEIFLGEDEPHLVSLTKNSPLEIVFSGCAPLLVLGVVISGGQITYEAGKLVVKLKPLGEGIQRLRAALNLPMQFDGRRIGALSNGRRALKDELQKMKEWQLQIEQLSRPSSEETKTSETHTSDA